MSTGPRNTVKDAWQGAAAERWLQELVRTEEMLQPFGQAALATLAAQSGEWVLDIGCGAGASSLELARLVGATGGVVGIDISEPLLARARERASVLENLGSLELILGDAATHVFARSFDGLFSRFGVMFFEDPQRAFTHLRRALKPTGRLAFVCWQALDHNPWAQVPLNAVRAVAPDLALPALLEPGLPGPFSLHDEQALQDLLSTAGFRHVDITAFERPVCFAQSHDTEAAADFCMRIGPASRFVAEADPGLAPAFRAAISEALQPYTSGRGTWLDAATFVVSARN